MRMATLNGFALQGKGKELDEVRVEWEEGGVGGGHAWLDPFIAVLHNA